MPGPGQYFSKKGKRKSLHYRSQSFRTDPNGRGFMTSTKREGFWDNTLEAPFTKGTNILEGPGPGNYPGGKKNENKLRKYNMRSDAKPAFNSTDDRS